MPTQPRPTVPLSEMTDGQEADTFALLAGKEELVTRSNKPYFRVTFRDARREVSFPIWCDAPWFVSCRDDWRRGEFYKMRAVLRETTYGPQLEIQKIRPVVEADRAQGFDEELCRPQAPFSTEELFAELVDTAQRQIADAALAALVVDLLEHHRETLLLLPAAAHHHHTYLGGWLEHVVAVVRNATLLVDRYLRDYPARQPPLARDVVIAGAILHDIGKVRELEVVDGGAAAYTPDGELIGHILLGRDMVREAAARHPLDAETQLRLEHLIVAHQRSPEWGSPKPPMTPEAWLVHIANELDARLAMYYEAFDAEPGAVLTSKRNPMQHRLFRGLVAHDAPVGDPHSDHDSPAGGAPS